MRLNLTLKIKNFGIENDLKPNMFEEQANFYDLEFINNHFDTQVLSQNFTEPTLGKVCSSWDMQPSDAPHWTQLQQEELGDGEFMEGKGYGEGVGSLLKSAGDKEYLEEEGRPFLLLTLPQHMRRPS